MEILFLVAEAGSIAGLFTGHQDVRMAFEAETLQFEPEKMLIGGCMRGMAAEAVVGDNRRMNAFLAGPVVMALVAERRTSLLDLAETVIVLVVAVSCLMAGGTLSVG